MEFKDYYAIMGLQRDATAEQIKQAYRKLARKYHPDVSQEPDAEQRFKDVGEAYEVLRDTQKRAAYDQLGAGPSPGEDFRAPPDWGSGFEFRGAADHAGPGFQGDSSEFFETLFGRAGFQKGAERTRPRRERGEDHHARVIIDLEASLEGAARTVKLRIPEADENGRPHLRERTLNVKIPKGIQAGQHIRLAGQGEKLAGNGKPGDLFLEMQFASHQRYRADGRDLHVNLPLAPWEAALGATVPVPTPGGSVELRIPPGSRAGARLRLKGRGLPSNPPGDLYATLQVVLPPSDTEQAREAWRLLAAAIPFDPRAEQGD